MTKLFFTNFSSFRAAHIIFKKWYLQLIVNYYYFDVLQIVYSHETRFAKDKFC